MRLTLMVHIAAGFLGLASGYVALYAAKGDRVHRGAGRVFVYAMLTMALAGFAITVRQGIAPAVNVPAALLTAYLVTSALLAVTSTSGGTRWVTAAGMLLALGIGTTQLAFGVEAIANGGSRDGMPAFPFIMFAAIGLLGGVGDYRVLRSGPPRGSRRLARHLWRMSMALFIAALSFFIGQMQVLPRMLRIPVLLALPVLAVLVTMGYWLWRVRFRRPTAIVPRFAEPIRT